MENLQEFLSVSFLGNTVEKYCWFIGIILSGIIFKRLLSRILGHLIYRLFKKQSHHIDVKIFFELTRKPIGYFLLMIFIYIAVDFIKLPNEWHLVPKSEFGIKMIIIGAYEIFFLSTVIWICLRIADFTGLILLKKAELDDNKINDHIIPFAIDILKVTIAVFGVFIILGTVFKLNIGSIVAGLGIGGLAVALAAKETLENLFGSFTIFADKPFTIGDQVKVGNYTGVVEKIGFRSTRLRTADKSYVTIPNKKMIDAELDNLSLRTAQRAFFSIYLNRNVSVEKISVIIKEIETYINSIDITEKDAVVKFADLENGLIKIMIQYFVNSDSWDLFINTKQDVNFMILNILKNNNAELAFPSQSLFIDQNSSS
jgi:MscS family membrane protein